MKTILFILFGVLLSSSVWAQTRVEYGAEVQMGRVVVAYKKLTPTRSGVPQLTSMHEQLLRTIGAKRIIQKYPNAIQSSKPGAVDLRLLYEIEYTKPYSAQTVADFFAALPEVEYANPKYLMHNMLSVNDPTAPQQYYLETVQAYKAWDIETGDTSVVIGIVDSGVDLGHEDLIEQIAYNRADPINGIDDENDGYIDNFKGWDLANNDNNPNTDVEDHGTTVAGPAIAQANNNKFIAGIAQHCRFLPVKETDSLGALTMGYEAIVYAAEHGCKIINCSWGSTFNTPHCEEIIKYASINKGALVIAAAGNTNDYSVYYPASIPLVMSVAATTAKDERWSPLNTDTKGGSSFNYFVDISAPGAAIQTIAKPNKGFYVYGGTSIAAPVVSGCAALIASNRPWLNMQQVRAQLEVTAKNIDTIPFNQSVANMMGRGRVDAYKALTDTLIPAIRFESIAFSDGVDNHYLPNRTISISGTFHNLLHGAGACTVQLRPISSFMNITQGTFIIDTLARGASVSNDNKKFQFSISDATPLYYTLYFKILYKYKDHTDQEYFSLKVNNQIVKIQTPSLQTTVSATGRLGYVSSSGEGIGMLYKGNSVLSVAGLMIAESTDSVISCSMGTQEFMPLQVAHHIDTVSPWETLVQSRYNDNFDNSNRMNLEVTQHTATLEGLDVVVCRYTISNKSQNDIKHLIVGQLADWGIGGLWSNRLAYDASSQMSYAWNTLANLGYCGQLVLEGSLLSHHALDGYPTDSTIDISTDFTDAERYRALSTWHNTAGNGYIAGSDVLDCMSSGPFLLKHGDSITTSFALLVAPSLDSLRNLAKHVRSKVFPQTANANIENSTDLHLAVQALDNNQLAIQMSGSYCGTVTLSIYSADGRVLSTQQISKQQTSETLKIVQALPKAFYLAQIQGSNQTATARFVVSQ